MPSCLKQINKKNLFLNISRLSGLILDFPCRTEQSCQFNIRIQNSIKVHILN